MSSTIALITGGNAGIGYATVVKLLESSKSYKVILAGRSLERANEAAKKALAEVPNTKSSISTLQLDVVDDSSIEAAAKKVEQDFGRLDVLVNNAGASFDPEIAKGKVSMREGWNRTWDTNVTGTHIVTHAFAGLLVKSSDPRLIFITSGVSSLEEASMSSPNPVNKPWPAGWPKDPSIRSAISYRASKTGLNMVMKEWAKMLFNDGVKTWSIAPGFLATGLGGENLKALGAGEPSEGGISIRKVIEGERDADATKVVRNYASPVQPY